GCSFPRERAYAHQLCSCDCLNNTHNMTGPINPCAEPDWQSFKLQDLGRQGRLETCFVAPGERAPGRVWGKCPQTEGAKRRQALVRNAAPGGSPCGKARPFSGREQPAHNADRRAYRRLAAAFFLRPRDRLLKRTGAPFTE